jgi:hypothetical protein
MLADVSLPVVDRAVVQKVFGLGRRQAIEIMHQFGGYQAGKTFLIGREELIAQLDAICSGDDYIRENARREKLTASMEAFRRTRQTEAVHIPVAPDVFDCDMEHLGPGVRLQAGKLEIEFADPLELLGKLFRLAQAVSNDYGGFERSVSRERSG